MSNLDDIWSKEVQEFEEGKSKPEKDEIFKFFGESLVNEYRDEFEKMAWDIPFFGQCTFHVLLGQMSNIRNIRINIGGNYEDCRIHFFLLQESGTGKGMGFNFSAMMSKRLGLNLKNSDDLTENSLIGAVNDNDEVNYGLLDPRHDPSFDIFASEEGSRIIDTSDKNYTKGAINTFQSAMNSIGTAANELSKDTAHTSRTISFNTHASFLFTSYPPTNIFKVITQTGFLQRMIVLYIPWSLQDKLDVNKKHAEKLEIGEKEEVEMMNVTRAIKKINAYYEDTNRIPISDSAKKILVENVVKSLHQPLLYLDKHTQHEMKKFTTRYQTILYKLAWHRCITRFGDEVSPRDIMYAKNMLLPIFKQLIGYIETEYRVDEKERERSQRIREEIMDGYHKLKNNGSERPWIRSSVLEKYLKKKWNVSRHAVRNKLKDHGSIFQQRTMDDNIEILRMRKNAERFNQKRI